MSEKCYCDHDGKILFGCPVHDRKNYEQYLIETEDERV